MDEAQRRLEEERRLRRAAVTAAQGQPPPELADRVSEDRPDERPDDEDDSAPAQRMEQQALWADLQVRNAMARGDFDNLPGAGKPIRDLGSTHDPDWWVKRLVEREQVSGVLPPALSLRRDDAELDGRLDAMSSERDVRRAVEEFNAAVLRARYTPVDGPPLITMPRDVEETLVRWRDRRDRRLSAEAREVQRRRDAERIAREQSRARERLRDWWHRRRPAD